MSTKPKGLLKVKLYADYSKIGGKKNLIASMVEIKEIYVDQIGMTHFVNQYQEEVGAFFLIREMSMEIESENQ